MPNLTPVALQSTLAVGEPTMWHATCDTHQWAVKDGNIEAVEALIREHVREHPAVHCPPPPATTYSVPSDRVLRYKQQRFEWRDGSVTYCGQCGLCPHPGWNILHSTDPVDAYMEEHWVLAHGS